jgi:dTDP-4-dehydrorhamnose 3,5-epimerase
MIQKTKLEGLLIIEGGQTFEDERGYFRETFKRDEFEEVLGKPWVHVQENHAMSYKNVLRGIHAAPWDKLIYVPFGRVLAVIVDLRKDSPTFKQYEAIEIGDNNRVKLFIPTGLGNSYIILSDEAIYEYQVNQYYEPGVEKGIAWNDPDLAIDWPVKDPILSEKDQNNPSLNEFLAL